MGKVKFIADIGSNHNQNIIRTYELISKAKEIGCWGVKFQLFKADLLWRDKETAQKMIKRELPINWIPKLSDYCKKLNIKFGCTPFYLLAVDILSPHVDFLKIGSYELLYHRLIKRCAFTDLPIMMSLGMATNNEIMAAISEVKGNWLMTNTCQDLILFHCNSSYPAEPRKCDMSKIREYYDMFISHVGWSDHTRQPGIIYNAVSHGAKWIEFHLDLEDRRGFEFEYGHCWKPSEVQPVIRDVEIWMESNAAVSIHEFDELRSQRTNPIDGMRPFNNE